MRALTLALPLVFVLACGEDQKDDTQADDTSSEDTTELFDTGLYGETIGARPDEFLGLPEFQATAHSGEPRGQEDLLGHPSVLWFYPMADTSG